MRETRLGNLFGLTLTAEPSAFAGSLLLWATLSALAAAWLKVPFVPLGFTDGSTLLRWWGKA